MKGEREEKKKTLRGRTHRVQKSDATRLIQEASRRAGQVGGRHAHHHGLHLVIAEEVAVGFEELQAMIARVGDHNALTAGIDGQVPGIEEFTARGAALAPSEQELASPREDNDSMVVLVHDVDVPAHRMDGNAGRLRELAVTRTLLSEHALHSAIGTENLQE